ncbi:vomeronasal type-2 receptor 116-like [Sigmodon hispidus]
MDNYQSSLGFIFAIEEINKNPHILPNTSIGFDLYHVQRGEWDFLREAFLWLTGMEVNIPNYTCRREKKSVVLLTGTSWVTSAHIGRLLNLYKYPQKILTLLLQDVEGPRSVCSESCVPGFRKSPQEGKATCCYDCIPCPENEISNETDMDNCMKCPESYYANIEQNNCFQKAVTFLSYEDPLGLAFSCMALGCSLLTAGVLSIFVKHHHTPIVKANNRVLTYILLITLAFGFLCPFFFIGKPNIGTCIMQQSTFMVLFTVALSTVLAKTFTVVLAFKVTVPGRMVRWLMMSRASNFIIPICILIQLVLCGIWMSTSPPFIDSDAHFEHGHIIIVCNKGSELAFHCALGFLCFLALGSYTMAYLAKNLPDTFNEAKFLTFSMLIFFSVWVSFLPVYHSTKGKVTVAMEIFCILVSNAGLLGCIFVPKCYIIFLEILFLIIYNCVSFCVFETTNGYSRVVTPSSSLFSFLTLFVYMIDNNYSFSVEIECCWIASLLKFFLCSAFPSSAVQRPLQLSCGDPCRANYVLRPTSRNYQISLAFMYAIEEINRNAHILPNKTLGFELYHDHSRKRKVILNYTCRRQKLASLLTGTTWKTSACIGRLLNLYKYPQISFGPFDTLLSDGDQFSSLYQTAPKETSLSHAIAILMVHFNWTWVGLVVTEDHKGDEFLSDLRGELDRNRVCVAFIKMIPESSLSCSIQKTQTVYLQLLKSPGNVVIMYGNNEMEHCIIMLIEIFLKPWKVWVMNSQWEVANPHYTFIFDMFHGSLIFAPHHDEIADFKKFMQTYTPSNYPEDYYLALLWHQFFNCSLSDCKILGSCLPNMSLDKLPRNVWEMDMTEESYNMYNSVYALAHSLHELTEKQVQIQPHNSEEINTDPWELHTFLKKDQFKNGGGSIVILDSQKKINTEYDIFNLWYFPDSLKQKVKVGTFSPEAPQGQKLFLSDHMILWATRFTDIESVLISVLIVCIESCTPGFRKSPQEGRPPCCYDCTPCPENEISNVTDMDHCVRCPESHYANTKQNSCLQKAVTFLSYEDPLGKALTYMSLGFSTLTAGVTGVFVKYHHTPIVKANNQTLTYILLITLTFCFLCPLLFIGHPNTATCILQQSTFGVLFTIALSTILAKSITVVLAFRRTLPGRIVRWMMISRAFNFIIPICTFIQFILTGIWLIISPPFIDSDVHSEHGHIIIMCNKGSTISFHSLLGYLCSMALGSYTMAYLSRNLPDTFNEAKFITFSMLVFFSVWVTFLPVYHSTKGKLLVAMEVFSILASSIGLLSCIFVPKCYIILLKPHKNSIQEGQKRYLRLPLLLQALLSLAWTWTTNVMVYTQKWVVSLLQTLLSLVYSPFCMGQLCVPLCVFYRLVECVSFIAFLCYSDGSAFIGIFLFKIPKHFFCLHSLKKTTNGIYPEVGATEGWLLLLAGLGILSSFPLTSQLLKFFVCSFRSFMALGDPCSCWSCLVDLELNGNKAKAKDITLLLTVQGYSKQYKPYKSTSRNYQISLAFMYAIEEINRNTDILPNTTLGFELYHDHSSEWDCLNDTFLCLTGKKKVILNYTCRKQKPASLLTGTTWKTSARIGRLLNLYKYPQISFGPFDTLLSDRGQFRSLYQTATKDTSLSQGIAILMVHFRWTWVGLVLIDDHKGNEFLSDLRGEMDRNRVCIAFTEMIPDSSLSCFIRKTQTAYLQILNSPANVVIMYGNNEMEHCIIMLIESLLKPWKVWVMNSQWEVSNLDYTFIFDKFHGSLIFAPHHGKIADFRKFMQTYNPSSYPEDYYLAILWHRYFNCSLSDCKILGSCLPNMSLDKLPRNVWEMDMTEESYSMYNSVYAVAHSLHELTEKQVQIQPHKNEEINTDPWKPAQLHFFLKNNQFKNGAGSTVILDSQKKIDTEYDIFNLWNFPESLRQKMKVGTFSPKAPQGQKLFLSDHMIQWATGFTDLPHSVCSESCTPGFRKSPQEGRPPCCYDCTSCPENEISNVTDMDHCVRCPESHYANTKQNSCLQKAVTFLSYEDPLGKALTYISLGFAILTAGVIGVFVKNHHTPIVKANNQALTYILLITLTFCFLCPLLFIGHPTTATCILQQSTFGVLFTIALSTILAKSITVVLAFRVTVPGRIVRWMMISRAPNFIIPICTFIQFILTGIWLIASPPFIDSDVHSEHGHIIIMCNKGSTIAFHSLLGYLCSMALGSYTMAYLTRNLPDTFNEAKFITFSMLVFFGVWVTFFPVYHSTKGKLLVAMEVFSILASSSGLLSCIFVPKCYIILLKPDKNVHFRQMPCGFSDKMKLEPEKSTLFRELQGTLQYCFAILKPNSRNYQISLAFMYAIEEINRNTDILPNTTLGFELYHVHSSEWDCLNDTFLCLTGKRKVILNYTCRKQKPASLLTGTTWKTSARIGRLLNLYKYPQLSFGPFDTLLSDRDQFSSLYQTAPKDTSLSHGIVILMVHFRWTWVGLVLIEDHKGDEFLSDLRGEMDRNGICISFVEMIPDSSLSCFIEKTIIAYLQILESPANVVIMYGNNEMEHCIIMLIESPLMPWKVWVMNSQWEVANLDYTFIFDKFHGSLIFVPHHDKIPDFTKFMQIYNPSNYPEDYYLAILWHQYFNCSLSDCKILGSCLPNMSLDKLPRNVWEMDLTEESYSMYNSVYAVAHSLHELTEKQVQIQPHKNEEKNTEPWEILPRCTLDTIQGQGSQGPNLDSEQEVDTEYDIFNLWNFPDSLRQKVKVGTFSPKAPQGQKLFLSDHMIQWATGFTELPHSVCSESCIPGFRKSPQEGKPPCCYDCTPCPENEISNVTDMDHCVICPESHYANTKQNKCLQKAVTFLSYEDPLGKALTYISLGFSILTAGVIGVFVKYHHTPIVKANNQALTYILLITLIFCFICPLLFIGHPNKATCILQQSTFGVLFTIALSTILAKSITVVLAFRMTVPGRIVRWMMISRAPNFIIPICTFIQFILTGIWLITSPPFIDSDAYSEHGHIIIICNKGSTIAFHSVLGYLCSMALGSYTMAYLSRNLPDTFNEAKFITFSMLVFFSVWVTFLPVYHSTKGKLLVAMEVFSILASSIGLLSCIFVPKCYIVLLKPHRNNFVIWKNKTVENEKCESGSEYQINETKIYDGTVMIAAFKDITLLPKLRTQCLIITRNYNYLENFATYVLRPTLRNYQISLAFMYAIEEINRNTDILPNKTLGFELYHDHSSEWDCLNDTFLCLTGKRKVILNYTCRRQKPASLLTGTTWKTSARIGRLLNLYKYPQISFGPFDSLLSDRGQFSSLYQTAPKDTSLSHGIAILMVHFTWTWVGLVLIDDHKGNEFLSDLRGEMDRNRVCLAFIEMIPESSLSCFVRKTQTAYVQILKSPANVVIMYGNNEMKHCIIMLIESPLTPWKVWVMNSQWEVSNLYYTFIFDKFHGSLIFAPHHGKIADFRKFMQIYNPSSYPEDYYLAILWHQYFNCSLSNCKILGSCLPNMSLDKLPRNVWEMDMTEESYNMYNSVYAVAHSLHELTEKKVQIQPHQNEEINTDPWELHPFLKNNQFKNGAGSIVILDSQKKIDTEYDIFNLWNFPESLRQKMKVGTFSPTVPQGQKLFLSDHMVQWATGFTENSLVDKICESCIPGFRKSPQEGRPPCCYDCTPCAENEISNVTDMDHCVRCPESHYANTKQNSCLQKAVTFLSYEDPLGKALTYMSLGFSVLTAGVIGVFVKNHHTPIVKANNQALTYILLITLTFCFLCPLLFIGHPNTATCILQQSTFGVLFTIALSTILAKSITVVLAFRMTVPGRIVRWMMISRAPNFIIPICTFIQFVLTGIWLITSPPFIDSDAYSEHGHIIIMCNKGSTIAFHSLLGYLCSMALGSYTMAYLSRNLPDTFNEAKFITFSMLVFFSVWITFLPVYHSTKGKLLVAMEFFSILASSIGLLSCIFVPKCYIILLKPHRNAVFGVRRRLFPATSETTRLMSTPSRDSSGFELLKFFLCSAFPSSTVHVLYLWLLLEVEVEKGVLGPTSRNYQISLAFMYAIEEINRNTHILPNTSLGFELYHDHSSEWDCLNDTLLCLTGKRKVIPNYTCRKKKPASLLTGTTWKTSARIGRLLNLYKYPQISFGPFDTLLSDRGQFNSLYQTATKDTSLSHGIAILMVHFTWTWVGLVLIDDHKGNEYLLDLRGEMDRNRVCVAFIEMIPESSLSYFIIRKEKSYSQLHMQKAKACFSTYRKNMENICTYWETTESLQISTDKLPRNIWEMDMTEESYSMYNSVYAVAHSLHELTEKQVQIQPHQNEEIYTDLWQLHDFLKNKQLKNGAGSIVILDSEKEVDTGYDIFNLWNFPDSLRQKVKVGTFSPKAPQGQKLFLSDHMIQWATGFTELPRSVCSESCTPGFRKSSQEGKPPCCYDCTPCPENEISNVTDMDHCVRCTESHYANTKQTRCLQKAVTFLSYEDPLGKALTYISLGFSILTAGVIGVKYHHTPIVKANNQALTYILLITLTFCFLCPLLFIGHPNTATCILQQSTFGVLFTIALSTILAKSITVVLAFRMTVPGKIVRWMMISRAPNFIIPICTFIQFILTGIWLITSPPFIDSDVHSEHGHIIIICNKGSTIAFHSLLGYLCSMALGSYTMAYLSRNLPDTFNEAKFITFSMLVFFSVWVTFLPVYHSTKGKLLVAMEVFSILASSIGLLSCIFVPKCYIILLKPHKNSPLMKLRLIAFVTPRLQRPLMVYTQKWVVPVCLELNFTTNGWKLPLLLQDGFEAFPSSAVTPRNETTNEWKLLGKMLSFYRGILLWPTSRNYQISLAFMYAIEEINRNTHILPNTSLGFELYHDHSSEWDCLNDTFLCLTGKRKVILNYTCRRQKPVSLLTGTTWKTSARIGRLLNLYKYPQISFGPFDTLLSDRGQFASLYQTALKGTSLSHGIAILMVHFSWTWVGLVLIDDHKGNEFLSDLRGEMDKNRICAAFIEMIPDSSLSCFINKTITAYVQILKSPANVVIMYGNNEVEHCIIMLIESPLMPWKVWIMNSQWEVANLYYTFLFDKFHGSLIFVPHHDEIADFRKFIQTYSPSKYPEDYYLAILWHQYFNCSFSDCKILSSCLSNISLDKLPRNVWEMDMTEESYNMYNSVYAVAHSLHELTEKQVQIQPHKNEAINMDPWEFLPMCTSVALHHFLKNKQFKNGAGSIVILDSRKEVDTEYDIFNLWNFPDSLREKMKVGTFSPKAPQGQKLFLSFHMIQWATGFTKLIIFHQNSLATVNKMELDN